MKRYLICAAICVVLTPGISAGGPWASYRFAPNALQEIDLTSNTAWTLSVDDGPPRPIKVTAGGWNSDQQEPPIASAAVKDHVVYQRTLEIPAEANGKVVKVLFGGCNYGAEVFLDDQKVAQHNAPMTPFEADLTGLVAAGKPHRLRVKAYSRYHFGRPPNVTAGFDFNKGITGQYEGCTKYPYGLTGHVRLAIYPPVCLSEVFVRPSVQKDQLEARLWVRNATAQDQRVTVAAALAPWKGRAWQYPALPSLETLVRAHSPKRLTLGPVSWRLGPESYWWPNVPFRQDYQATLHWLNVAVSVDGKVCHQHRERFGFVQYAEGPYYYTVNGVRFNSFGETISYGQVGEYDCWTETPCFQPPQGDRQGCPETWRRYQRIGFNSMRLSTSVPTAYMLETADAAGYMLIPEGGSWGNGTCTFHKENFSRQLQAMLRACRNHPCVARYSLANESLPGEFASPDNAWRWLIDAAGEVDDTRPYVFEVNNGQTGAVPGMKAGRAQQMEHYRPIVKSGDHLRGMGECAWATDGMAPFGVMAMQMRGNDWAHFAPWSWVNFWPNFLEGMNHQRHPWKFNDHADRNDARDGWGSPIVTFVQRALNPYLVVDHALLEANGNAGEQPPGKVDWPAATPAFRAGTTVARQVELFNGGLAGRQFELHWAAHWDAPDGELFREGHLGAIEIEPGFHATRTVEFALPPTLERKRALYLVLESVKEGKAVYREDRVRFTILPAGNAAAP